MDDTTLTLTLNHRDLAEWANALADVVTSYRERLSGQRMTSEIMDAMATKLNDAIIENVLGHGPSTSAFQHIGFRWTNNKEEVQE